MSHYQLIPSPHRQFAVPHPPHGHPSPRIFSSNYTHPTYVPFLPIIFLLRRANHAHILVTQFHGSQPLSKQERERTRRLFIFYGEAKIRRALTTGHGIRHAEILIQARLRMDGTRDETGGGGRGPRWHVTSGSNILTLARRKKWELRKEIYGMGFSRTHKFGGGEVEDGLLRKLVSEC